MPAQRSGGRRAAQPTTAVTADLLATVVRSPLPRNRLFRTRPSQETTS
ncbi:hypothetical protein [Saccharothrix coeruleofusca]|nr:hypothetical protein [Saccharothrix coeruleofusca]MBP2335209.1 hypothetical protein [Saccharothrix coeruleofusca]